MAFCSKCAAQTGPTDVFCPACGAPQTGNMAQPSQGYQQQGYQDTNTDAANNKAMGILAYFGIFVLIPIFAAKNSAFARYHANQGLVLGITEAAYAVIVSVLSGILAAISWVFGAVAAVIFGILWLAFAALIIIGIINAASGKVKPLPVIGGITILK